MTEWQEWVIDGWYLTGLQVSWSTPVPMHFFMLSATFLISCSMRDCFISAGFMSSIAARGLHKTSGWRNLPLLLICSSVSHVGPSYALIIRGSFSSFSGRFYRLVHSSWNLWNFLCWWFSSVVIYFFSSLPCGAGVIFFFISAVIPFSHQDWLVQLIFWWVPFCPRDSWMISGWVNVFFWSWGSELFSYFFVPASIVVFHISWGLTSLWRRWSRFRLSLFSFLPQKCILLWWSGTSVWWCWEVYTFDIIVLSFLFALA